MKVTNLHKVMYKNIRDTYVDFDAKVDVNTLLAFINEKKPKKKKFRTTGEWVTLSFGDTKFPIGYANYANETYMLSSDGAIMLACIVEPKTDSEVDEINSVQNASGNSGQPLARVFKERKGKREGTLVSVNSEYVQRRDYVQPLGGVHQLFSLLYSDSHLPDANLCSYVDTKYLDMVMAHPGGLRYVEFETVKFENFERFTSIDISDDKIGKLICCPTTTFHFEGGAMALVISIRVPSGEITESNLGLRLDNVSLPDLSDEEIDLSFFDSIERDVFKGSVGKSDCSTKAPSSMLAGVTGLLSEQCFIDHHVNANNKSVDVSLYHQQVGKSMRLYHLLKWAALPAIKNRISADKSFDMARHIIESWADDRFHGVFVTDGRIIASDGALLFVSGEEIIYNSILGDEVCQRQDGVYTPTMAFGMNPDDAAKAGKWPSRIIEAATKTLMTRAESPANKMPYSLDFSTIGYDSLKIKSGVVPMDLIKDGKRVWVAAHRSKDKYKESTVTDASYGEKYVLSFVGVKVDYLKLVVDYAKYSPIVEQYLTTLATTNLGLNIGLYVRFADGSRVIIASYIFSDPIPMKGSRNEIDHIEVIEDMNCSGYDDAGPIVREAFERIYRQEITDGIEVVNV